MEALELSSSAEDGDGHDFNDSGGDTDDIDSVGDDARDLQSHNADIGESSATSVHCRSSVARHDPRSDNSCGVSR